VTQTSPQQEALQPGDVVGERYRVIGRLGSGGMGNVYRVEHTLMAKEMAMKLLRPELSVIPQVVERFEREAKSASRLDNEHIVRVTDFGRAPNGSFYLIMELLSGESLGERMHRKGSLSVAEALEVIDQILEALEHAHENSVVHRDLKPDNIMLVEKSGRTAVKILDFGLAKITSADDPREATLTQAGMVFGTPRYMAPEQAAAEPVDERTDLYAVGVLLYELLAGRPMFEAAGAAELLTCHLTQMPPPLNLELPDRALAADLERTVMRALEKHKRDRFQTAREFREVLYVLRQRLGPLNGVVLPIMRSPSLSTGLADTRIRAGSSSASSSASMIEPAPLFARPRFFLAGLIGVAGLAAAIVFSFSSSTKPPPELPPMARAEQALARGDLSAARAILAPIVAGRDHNARADVLLGHLSFAEGDVPGAVSAYKKALELDGSSARDPVMVANAKRIVEKSHDEKKNEYGAQMVTALALHADSSAAGVLADLAENAPTHRMRSHAFQGLERLGETKRLNVTNYLGNELERVASQSCKTRKWYIDRLIALDDPKALSIFKRELVRRGGLFNLENINACMESQLRQAIERFEPKK
jgi:eukaryotic-like serine/threonine-protein kinase